MYLAIDEFISFHEHLITPFHDNIYKTSGFLLFAWIIPYSLMVVVMFIVFFKLIIILPAKIRSPFVLSGVLYCIGTIVFEAISGKYIDMHNWSKDSMYFTLTTIEEAIEILGISLFIYTLIKYIQFLDEKNNNKSSAQILRK